RRQAGSRLALCRGPLPGDLAGSRARAARRDLQCRRPLRDGEPRGRADDLLAPRKDGRSYSAQIEFVADRPGHDRRYAIDCSKLQRELGWRPLESFATGLARTVDWYIGNRAWCAEITA